MSDQVKLIILIITTFIISICLLLIGSQTITPITSLFTNDFVVYTLRMPKLILAFTCGGLLAISGYILQRMTKNPIITPDILGISSGATFGIILFYYLYMDMNSNSVASLKLLPVFCLSFSLIVMVYQIFVLKFSKSMYRLILFGLAISAFFNSLGDLLISSGQIGLASEVAKFKSGTLSQANPKQAVIMSIIMIIAVIGLMLLYKYIVVSSINDTKIITLGIKGNKLNLILLIYITACVSLTVMFVGMITFIGIIAPNIVKRFNLNNESSKMIAVFLVGSIILISSELIANNLFYPIVVPAGTITAIVGIPMFVYAVFLERRKYGN